MGKCPVCNTSVYPADPQVNLDRTIYHKSCAKCADCSCQITLSNFTKSGDTLFCKTHYFERFSKTNTYIGGESFKHKGSAELSRGESLSSNVGRDTTVTRETSASSVSSISTLGSFGGGSPSAGSGRDLADKVEALKVVEEDGDGEGAHGGDEKEKAKKDADAAVLESGSIFSLPSAPAGGAGDKSGDDNDNDNDNKSLDPPPQATRTNSSYSTASVSSTGSSVRERMAAFSRENSAKAACPACKKTVYPNDPQIVLDGVKYHKSCAKCEDCSCQITLSNFTKNKDLLLCKTHYFERFSKTNSYVGGDGFKHKNSAEIARGDSKGSIQGSGE